VPLEPDKQLKEGFKKRNTIPSKERKGRKKE